MTKNISGHHTGISLLKLLLCYIVVVDHFQPQNETLMQHIAYFTGNMAVPCFMFLSFYLTRRIFDECSADALKNRLKRLFMPILFWTAAYYILFSVVDGLIDWREMIYSLIYGSSFALNSALWFLNIQIILVCILFIVCYISDSALKRTVILFCILTGSFILQYTGVNHYLYSSAVYESRFALGRILETMPFAISGLLYAQYRDKLSPLHHIILCACLLAVSFIEPAFSNNPVPGYGYGGLGLFCRSAFVCICFMNLPQIKSAACSAAINTLAKYTLGVYCLHWGVGTFLDAVTLKSGVSFFQGTLFFDSVIYLISFIATFVMAFIAKKLKFLTYMIS